MDHYTQALQDCFTIVDHKGRIVQQNLLEPYSQDELLKFYETLVLIRQFDKKAVSLQRTGQLGTYPSCLGQEAFSAGVGFAMEPNDLLVPYYRDQAAQYIRGVPLSQLLQLWGGDERANLFEGIAAEDFPICVPIATQITHAAGVATAFKARGQKRVAVATCGEGASSRGDFYEAINLAGVWQLPLVVVVNNNQWAISVPRELQTGAETIAQKAIAAGIPSERVNGNDVIAVHHCVKAAIERARSGKGATLIEAVSYRLGDHTTADDATRYRPPEEVKAAWQFEPVKRMQSFLHQQGCWDAESERKLLARVSEEVEAAAQNYLSIEDQKPTDFIDYLFEELPFSMQPQREHCLQLSSRSGGHHGH